MDAANVQHLITLGVLMSAGFMAGTWGERIGIPRVASYVVVGALFSEELLGSVLHFSAAGWSAVLTDTALGAIAFMVGAEFQLKWLRRRGGSILLGALGQSLGAVLTVTLGIWAFGRLFMGSLDLGTTLVLGAIASATAPAATIAVIEEYRARGPLTRMLLSLVAIDDMLAIILFTAAMSLAGAGGEAGGPAGAAREVGLSAAAGAALGLCLGWFARRVRSDELRLPVVLGFIFLTLGVSGRFGLSSLLSCMVLGYVSKLVAAEESDLCLAPMGHIREAIFLIFFTLAGAHFQFRVLTGSAAFIVAYILLRTAGKYGGALLGTWAGGAPERVRRNVGLGLLPQAGVSIGLALTVSEAAGFSHHASLILNTIIGSTIIFELSAPVASKLALKRAGEIDCAKEE
jgi:Kef-type K+ transport system membrane component KefB